MSHNFRVISPKKQSFPVSLIIEAMAQSTAMLGLISADEAGLKKSDIYYLVSVDHCRFRKIVVPGDSLHITAEAIGLPRRGMWRFNCKAMVEGELVAEAQIMSAGVNLLP